MSEKHAQRPEDHAPDPAGFSSGSSSDSKKDDEPPSLRHRHIVRRHGEDETLRWVALSKFGRSPPALRIDTWRRHAAA